MSLLEIRIGKLKTPEQYREVLPSWPEKEFDSSYFKDLVETAEATTSGLRGNEIGYPTHHENSAFRGALVSNQLVWDLILQHYPSEADRAILTKTLVRGCLGENFFVNDPALMPGVVCVGDVYRIGSAIFEVTGPRRPCSKVDCVLGVKGMTQLALENGWAGYFMRAVESGRVTVGDEIVLLNRPYPGYTIERLARGLWGKPDVQDNSREFLSTLAGMEMLIPRGYRETAQLRLQRLQQA